MLVLCFLFVLMRSAGAQILDPPPSNDMPGFSNGPQGAVPDTPEQPQNDIHVETLPEVHPDIIEGSPEIPPPPSLSGGFNGNNNILTSNPPPAEPVNPMPAPEGQPLDAPVDAPIDLPAPEVVPPTEPPPAVAGNLPEVSPPEQPAPPPVSEEDKGPFNPWRVPSPGQPAVELQAGSSFNFSWTSNTEGLVNLELWKIENNTPVPKFLLACESLTFPK